MRKKNIFIFLTVLIVAVFSAYWFYKFASWYEQTLGMIFAYIVIISFLILVFMPFKLMKDNKTNISILNYTKYMGCALLKVSKGVINILKEAVLTVVFIFSRLFSKKPTEKIKETIE